MAKHLSMEEREAIGQMRYAGRSEGAIARELGRAPSTISRELRRNGSGGGYSAVAAQRSYQERRRRRPLVRKLDRAELDRAVRRGLARCWSPDQISGRLRREHPADGRRQVSPQTIYEWIRNSPHQGHWERRLRRGGRRRPPDDRRGKLRGTVAVAERPAVVDRRERFGDWEGDTLVGARHRGAVVTHVERKSGFLLTARIDANRSRHVNRATRRLFAELPAGLRRTLTLDNGKEFAAHEAWARQTGLAIYFAAPYAAWQRGTNENTNGLLRQYFPKGTDFTAVSRHELRQATRELNDRPRKRLGYRTPAEVLPQYFPHCI